jgi:PAS domain S-box-containing protein
MRRNDSFSWLKHQLYPLLTLNKSTAQFASVIVILVGFLVLLGWSLEIAFLKSPIFQGSTMKANTAVGFILAGISLGLQTFRRQSVLITSLTQGCVILVSTIGFLSLCQYLFQWDLGIDELLFEDLPISPNTVYPGRMGDNTALNFVLTGLALWLNGQKTRRSYYVAQIITSSAALIALLALVGYAFNVQIFYRFIFYSTSMAIHTALTFLVLCIGILSLQRNYAWMRILTSNSLGGIVARQLIFAAFGLPLVLGWLIRQGQLAGLYDPNFELSLMVMSLIVISLGLIGRSASIIDKIDSDRQRSADRWRSSQARLKLALTSANQGIWDWNLQTKVLIWDDCCKKIFGLTADFPVTDEWQFDALHPDDRERVLQARAVAIRERTDFCEEYRTFYPDGTMRWILAKGRGYYDEMGEPKRMLGTVIDISDRKQSEAALNLQEQRYRHIFESVGVSIWEEDFSEVKMAIDRLKASGVEDFERYFNEHPEFVQWAIGAIRVIDVNDISLQIYGARDKAQLLRSMSQICLPETIPAFIEEFLAIATGQTFLQGETVTGNLQGKRLHTLFTIIFPPPSESYDRVLVTCADISDRKQIETALQKSESRFQRLAANVPGVIYQYIKHLDGTDGFTYISSRSQDIYEYEPEVLLEDFSLVRQMIHPDDRQRVRAANTSSAERLEPFNLEFRLVPPSGRLKWVQTISMPERQSNGETIWDGIVIDISDRKQAQLHDRFLNRLDLRLRQLSDAKAMIWETVSSLGEYLNVDRCFWHEIDWEDRVAIIERNWHRPDVNDLAGVYPLENFFTSEQFNCLAAGQAIVVSDITTHPHTAPYAQSYQPIAVAAFIAIPCLQSGRWMANLSINCTTVRNWRDDEVTLLQEVVARLWSIIEHTRAVQALRASEYQYRRLFETIDQGFCVCQMLFDENGEPTDYLFLEVNPVFEQMTGLQEATGKTARELVPNLENFWIQIYGRVVLTGEPTRFENRSAAMNRWFNVSAFSFDEPQNNKFAVLFTNITARKQAEAELEERSEHMQILYEITRDLLSTNQPLALVKALFAKLKPLIGLDVYLSYIVDEQQQKLHLKLSDGISDENVREIEWLEIGQGACGTVAQQRCQIVQPNLQQSTDPKTELLRSLGLNAYSCQPLVAQEKLFGTLGFGSFTRTEFTPAETQLFQAICDRIAIALDREEILTSLQQQTEELKRLNRLKDEFLAALSHELRTPLNPIQGWTRLLKSGALNPSKTTEALTTIERNVKQQIALVNDLLDVSRIVQGQFQLTSTSQPVDLVPILNAAIDTVRFTAIAKSIELEFYSPTAAISQVMGDETRLQQIFWNLLANAIKFTPNGGCINIRLEQIQNNDRNNALVSITDTGIGISAEFLPHVFDRFRQADGSSTRRYGGLGLGLALVKHLVELHGGTVSAESPGEGRGATFKVNLPLLDRSADSPATNDPQRPPTGSSSSASLTGIRVLVVDDEPDNLDLLNFVLTQEGAIVTAITSATEVLAIVAENPPDILVSDIGMPEVNGYELLQRIRALPSQQNEPIKAIALTAFAQPEDEEQAINAGFQAYLSKPVNLVELITAIAEQV